MASEVRYEEMDPEVREFAASAKDAGYVVKLGSRRLMLRLQREKVGGWDAAKKHWYVSKIIAQGSHDLLESHGFHWKEKPGRKGKSGHQWWQFDGVEGVSEFRAVVAQLTGVPIP